MLAASRHHAFGARVSGPYPRLCATGDNGLMSQLRQNSADKPHLDGTRVCN